MGNAVKKSKDMTKTIERRFSFLRTLFAVLIALAIAFVLIATVSEKPLQDFITLLVGPLKSTSRMATIVSKAIPLLFTGTAVCLVYSCGQIKIGRAHV